MPAFPRSFLVAAVLLLMPTATFAQATSGSMDTEARLDGSTTQHEPFAIDPLH